MGATQRNEIELWNAAANDDVEPHPDWTEELEAESRRIKNEELTLKDTAVKREKQKGVYTTMRSQ